MIQAEAMKVPAVVVRGDVPDWERTYAVEKIGQIVARAPVTVLHAQLRLSLEPDPARNRPAVAEATLDLDGRFVRAHVAAPTLHEATDLMVARLRRRLERVTDRPQDVALRHREPGPGVWRHGDAPAERPEFFPRPPEERDVVRRKTFALTAETLDEAAFDLEALGHDFFLFTNADTGEDNVVTREGTGYVVHQPTPQPESAERAAAPLRVAPHPPAHLRLEDAISHLDEGGEQWVFFLDTGTGRGQVLYRRYDGHYGLISAR